MKWGDNGMKGILASNHYISLAGESWYLQEGVGWRQTSLLQTIPLQKGFHVHKALKNADLEQEEAAATKAIGRQSSPSLLLPHFPTSPWAAHSHLPLSQERGKYFPTHIRAQAQTPFLQHAGLKSCLWCFSNTPRSSNKLSRKRHRPRGTDPSTSHHVCRSCSLGRVSCDLYNCFRDRIIGYFIKTSFSPKTRL